MIASIKNTLVGYTKTGKSSYIYYLIHKRVYENPLPTIGGAFFMYKYNNIQFQIWDTAGDEIYIGLLPMYLRNAKIAILFYDITNNKTFERAKELQKTQDPFKIKDYFYILIGNKIDLLENRQVSYEEGKQFAQELKAPFFEVSSLTGEGVFESFELIYREYLQYYLNKEDKKKLTGQNDIKRKNRNCCIF